MRRMLGSFTFLGTGSSAGVPTIGCKCEVCSSSAPKNKRLRPSGLVQVGGKKLLLDIGPDFRQQALTYGIDTIDGLLLTHTHYDHIAGLDEVRTFNVREKRAMPCLLSQASYKDVQKRYDYMFIPEAPTAKFDFTVLDQKEGRVDFLGVDIRYCTFLQIGMQVNGFRFGDFAYICDIKQYERSIFSFLKGIRTLVLSSLRPEKSSFHLSFEEAVSFARKSGAKQTWLTHLGHFYDHEEYNAKLPPDVRAGYDGLKLEFTCTN